MMNKLEFIRALDAGSVGVSDSTADLWYHILSWVQAHEYADTADGPEFIKHVQSFRRVGVSTINRHLGRMAEAGFLKAHSLRRQLSAGAKEEMSTSLHGILFGGGVSALPTVFKRYTLPGATCPRIFKTFDRVQERNRAADEVLLESISAGKSFTT